MGRLTNELRSNTDVGGCAVLHHHYKHNLGSPHDEFGQQQVDSNMDYILSFLNRALGSLAFTKQSDLNISNYYVLAWIGSRVDPGVCLCVSLLPIIKHYVVLFVLGSGTSQHRSGEP
jgi:hypothetical protein